MEGRRKFTCFYGTNNFWRHFEIKEFTDYPRFHKAHYSPFPNVPYTEHMSCRLSGRHIFCSYQSHFICMVS